LIANLLGKGLIEKLLGKGLIEKLLGKGLIANLLGKGLIKNGIIQKKSLSARARKTEVICLSCLKNLTKA